MTDAQRGSVDNLIYLCGPHHDVIDAQLAYHTVEFLRAAKRKHEEDARRGVAYALGAVGFKQLEVVCQLLAMNALAADMVDPINLPIAIEQKITLNSLGGESVAKIRLGLAKGNEVSTYIQTTDGMSAGFEAALIANFRKIYYTGVSENLSGDELFDYVCLTAIENAGPRRTDDLEAAALAVVSHLFETCDIFEYEHSAAN